MTSHQSVRDIVEVARRLGALVDEVVFLGGAVVPLLVPEEVASTIRATEDVDCVVCTETYHDYMEFGERLRASGFAECREPGAPICRWTHTGVLLDLMPVEGFLSFSNR